MKMATIRAWHFYIGMLIAPSVLFFAITGALQLFSLHEAHGSYTPPSLVKALSAVHKDQVFRAGRRHDHAAPEPAGGPDADAAPSGAPDADAGPPEGSDEHAGHHRRHDEDAGAGPPDSSAAQAGPAGGPDADAGPPAEHDHGDKMKTSTLILKIYFFWIVSGGLILSTLFGIWIGVTHPLRRRTAWILLALGTAIPVVLLLV